MGTNHNRIKVADLEKNAANKILITNSKGELEFSDIESIASSEPVSAIVSGIVDNTPLQELGGVDKLINGLRIGRGSSTGVDNVVFGINSQGLATTANENTSMGFEALRDVTTGGYNSAFGWGVLQQTTTGHSNTAMGDSAMLLNQIGSYNTAIGDGALRNNNADFNVGVGAYSGYYNTTGAYNTNIGGYAGFYNTTGSYNTAIGQSALLNNQFGSQNIAIGASALYKNIGTNGSNIFGHRCIAIGTSAMRENTTGNGIAIGNVALGSQTTGMWNIGIGMQAGSGITTGGGNVVIAGTGFTTYGGGVTTGSNNLIVAPNNGNTTGITTGNGNIVIGKVSGLNAAAENTITISDGVGNIALTKSTTGELKVPNLTQALIISGGATSLINKTYADNMGAVDNATTTVLSGTALNSAYPNAINGFRVHCKSISTGVLTYEKTSTGWIQYAVSIVV